MITPAEATALVERAHKTDAVHLRTRAVRYVLQRGADRETWAALGGRVVALVDVAPGTPDREECLQLLAALPLASARRRLEAIAGDPDDPDRDLATRLAWGETLDEQVARLLRGLAGDRPAEALAALAALPIERTGLDPDTFLAAATGDDPDQRFWASVALGRLGRLDAVDALLAALDADDTPTFMWGAPDVAYARVARARPVPEPLVEHLLSREHEDRRRDALLTIWALTGTKNADGDPIGERAGAREAAAVAERLQGGLGLTYLVSEMTPDEVESLRALTPRVAGELLASVIGRVNALDDPIAALVAGNAVMHVALALDLSELPVERVLRAHEAAADPRLAASQLAFVLSRAPRALATDALVARLESADERRFDELTALLADIERFAGTDEPPVLGAGPGGAPDDAPPPPAAGELIDDDAPPAATQRGETPPPPAHRDGPRPVGGGASANTMTVLPMSDRPTDREAPEPAGGLDAFMSVFEGFRPDVHSRAGERAHSEKEPDLTADLDVRSLEDFDPGTTARGGASRPPSAPAPPAGPPQAPPNAPADPAGAAAGHGPPGERRYVNVEVEDHPPEEPLHVGEPYTLAFGVDVRALPGAVASTHFPDTLVFAPDSDVGEVQLTVQLNGTDFDISEETRPLRVPRRGKARAKARFDIVPRHEGPSTLRATLHHEGNLVQQIELTFAVGGATREPVRVTATGRPLSAAQGLRPRPLALSLRPSPAGGYDCTMWKPVSKEARLPIQQGLLAKAADVARQALLRVVMHEEGGEPVFQTGIDIPEAAEREALRVMARAGARLFQQLFYGPDAGPDARQIGDALRRRAGDRTGHLALQILATKAPLPWAMLYIGDASAGATLEWDNFLGMRHVIEQFPAQPDDSVFDSVIRSDRPALAVGINVHTGIDAQMEADHVARQRAFWERAAAARRVRVTPRTTGAEVVSALGDASTADQILYFYCHAESAGLDDRAGPDASCLVLSDASLSLGDLNLDAPTSVRLPGTPLVFINACESAQLSPAFYDGFVPYFMDKGARGVIGTECRMPACFATEWAGRFFERFLDGAPLGEAVLELRREFLREHRNPLGLLYSVHCDGDTRIEPALAAASG